MLVTLQYYFYPHNVLLHSVLMYTVWFCLLQELIYTINPSYAEPFLFIIKASGVSTVGVILQLSVSRPIACE